MWVGTAGANPWFGFYGSLVISKIGPSTACRNTSTGDSFRDLTNCSSMKLLGTYICGAHEYSFIDLIEADIYTNT